MSRALKPRTYLNSFHLCSVCLILELCSFGSLSDIIRGYGFDWSSTHRAPLQLSYPDILYLALGCARFVSVVMYVTCVHHAILCVTHQCIGIFLHSTFLCVNTIPHTNYATPQRAGGGACVRSLAVPPRRQELQLPRYESYLHVFICCVNKCLVATTQPCSDRNTSIVRYSHAQWTTSST